MTIILYAVATIILVLAGMFVAGIAHAERQCRERRKRQEKEKIVQTGDRTYKVLYAD